MSALTSRKAMAIILVAGVVPGGPVAGFELPSLKMFGGGGEPAGPNVTQDCPAIFIDNGASMIRMPPEADAASVRYQLAISSSVRECMIEGDKVKINVGVEGGAVLGPAGAPGTFAASINIAVRRLKDYAAIESKNYRVTTTVPAGATRGDFRLLAEQFAIPLMGKRPIEDYEILVGFTEGGAEAPQKPPRPAKKAKGGGN
jgi:hypothetical protein